MHPYYSKIIKHQGQKSILEFIDNYRTDVFFIIHNNEFEFISKSIERINGLKHEEFIKGGLDYFTSLIIHEDYIQAKQNFSSCLSLIATNRHRINLKPFIFRIKNSKGNIIWLESKLYRFDETEFRHKKSFCGVLRDITRFKLIEQYLWNILENQVDSEKELTRIKRKFKKLFIYSDSSHSGSPHISQKKKKLNNNGILNNTSKREREILQLIAKGYSSKQVASQLNISYHTVISHRKNLISKFHVHNTAELINKALNAFWL